MEVLFGMVLGVAVLFLSKKVYAMFKKKAPMSVTGGRHEGGDIEDADSHKPL